MRSVEGGRPDTPVFYGLLALIIWLPIPFGSNIEWASALFCIFASILLLLWALLSIWKRHPVPKAVYLNRWILALWALWLAWIAVQLIPLPADLLRILSPKSAGIYDQIALDGISQAYSISIDRGKTYQQLILSCGYLALYVLVLLSASDRRRITILASTIVLSGLVQALYGSVMVLSGIEYGFLQEKTAYLGYATGTFINRNHLAGYLELSSAVGIGLVLSDIRSDVAGNWRLRISSLLDLLLSRKFRVRVFVSIMVVGLVLTRSRMGNTAFFVSLLLCGGIYILLRERRLLVKSLLLFSSLLIIDIYIISNWYGLDKVVERVGATQVSTEARAHITPELVELVDDYLLVGSGLGTFSTAFMPYRVSYVQHYYDHAHNDYLEFISEVGIVGGLILAVLVLATVLHALRVIMRRRDRVRTGMALAGLMGLCALAIHSVSDFNLQIPAIAATLVVLMAMVNSGSDQSSDRVSAKINIPSSQTGHKRGLSTLT